ncbi:MAG: PEP-utilizing enzyme [Acidimicrobiia bacterium]|nr:PEP-utilizing enzyme [Acidimicrobiia bacterium]
MDEHGWALINYDGGVPVLAERPSMISKLVLAEPEAPVHDEADVLAERARAELPAERRAEFDAALAAARAVYPVREDNTIIVGDRPIALLRRWMLEAADRLVARGVLTSATQAPYLFVAELRAALAGPADAAELAELVARRRGEEAWARAFPGPAYVGEQGTPPDISKLPAPLRQVNEPVLWGVGHEYPPPTEVPDDPDVLLAGVPASPGVMEGTVRLVRSHHDMDRLLPGEILVCQVTSPAWAPVFPLASAVVADGGGALSHAAIAAREHGLPAVLGTGSATTTLIDGQRIRVDGTRGLVLAVEE